MATNPKKFKQSQTSSSKLKTQIVVEYYKTWIEVMFRNVANYGYKYGTKKHFAYIDLFAGSGTYDDGSHGTAAEIIKCIVSDPKQIDAVETVFNDMHKKSIESLSGCIGDICSNVNFRYPPKFFNEKVDIDFVNKILTQNIPTLFFLDPWGYKGLSLEAIRLGSSSFGCDGFFFFNYDGINRSLKEDNNLLEHMRLLFGSQAESLIKEVKSLEPSAREEKIVKTFEQEVRKINGVFVTGFRFMMPKKNRTSHLLYHVSKNEYGLEVFKETIAKLNYDCEDFPMYIFNPDTQPYAQDLSLLMSTQKEELAQTLLNKFTGQKISFEGLCKKHLKESLFTEKNHRKSLLYLEDHGIIKVDRVKANGKKIRKGTFPEEALISFP